MRGLQWSQVISIASGKRRTERSQSGATDAVASRTPLSFRSRRFFEDHLYTLQRPASIREQETKQVSLLEARDSTSPKSSSSMACQNITHLSQSWTGTSTKDRSLCSFATALENKLGHAFACRNDSPLQKGRSGRPSNLSAKTVIDHTPKNEDVRIKSAMLSTFVRRAQADRLQGDNEFHPRIRLRDHDSQSQRRAHHQ